MEYIISAVKQTSRNQYDVFMNCLHQYAALGNDDVDKWSRDGVSVKQGDVSHLFQNKFSPIASRA